MTSFSPDGAKIAYNRIFRNFRTWKKYYGGLAQDIWIYDLHAKTSERLTHWKGTDTDPMWYGNTIYFASDRGPNHRLNIWACDLKTKTFRQITHFKIYDVDWPSLGDTGIVFQCGGSLYVIDLPSEKLHKVDVSVPLDGVRTRSRWVNCRKEIRGFDAAPNGKRAVFDARGDIFTVPAKHGDTRDLTQTSNANEEYPAWSPDGKWVAYITDRTGEAEVAVRPSDGTGREELLTHRAKGYLYDPVWSPGSSKLAFSDSSHVLWYVDLKTKKVTRVDANDWRAIRDYSWSPDGRWLAYTKGRPNGMGEIYLYSLAAHKTYRFSTGMTNDGNPVFGPEGKYLYFISARHPNPAWSESEFNIATIKMDGVYVVTLRKDLPSPFAPRSDEGGSSAAESHKAETPWKAGAIAPFHIDLKDMASRAVPLPIPAADMAGLAAAGDRVYYMTFPVQGMEGFLPGEETELHVFDMKKREDHVLVSNLDDYALSADGSTVLYREKKDFFMAQAAPSHGEEAPKPDKLVLKHMTAFINPVQEWHEMFEQAWRLNRDLFYNPKMNGKDWNAVRAKYEKLLPEMAWRQDLNYIIGEMIGELQNSHCYVGGGDLFHNKYVPTGLLGVDFALDRKSGRYYFKKIYPGDNSRPDYRSPLTEPGIRASAGDYLLAVNGHGLKAPVNPYSLFVDTVGKTVTLTLADNPEGKGSWHVTVRPVKQELNIRLEAWIRHNRETVNQESNGKIGYVYLSDMESLGMDQFIRQFYPQIRKQGLIVDVRYNGGGEIDQIILERLRRILIGMDTTRLRQPDTIPQQVLHGYKVCLANHYSASDGDIFPYYFKHYKLGPVIGTRTWGGVRGYNDVWTLLDGGMLIVSEDSLYGLKSQWIIENHGVEPDIRVDDLPQEVMAGRDAQLQEGVKYILNELNKQPMPLPPVPAPLPAYPAESR
ncbi:MAG: S41 family peptidase [Acidobacteriota bacterium]